ncbi:hypothetical protein SPRG_20210 [Saprolegnia parasitica CBS 223.65]|uniref:Mediator of RNA polymerase II transcription subunit 17 n=1 Tax=Saprolegnia parasitica (strain CBS 223.65) TaxID=695850 RepID=A0A067CC16_SAPPC|nr:hypothetical protein SPRG_20210 [Saprolegnia parasitica CBS 223.65]KDO28048.1 hypothetical protein SPRG_20210 [Saprolegnia parasitica CBS 223.65]|eukprot:XP_012201199.1 hypothetical protein SPRG_20210 [Saprolegnia parasitica CBS 223.65]
MAQEDDGLGGIALFPDDLGFPNVECIQENGDEILVEELTDAQTYAHVIAHLERRRIKAKLAEANGSAKRRKTDDVADDETLSVASTTKDDDAASPHDDVIDPRLHYRPIVSELQAATVELHQLINTIDLLRRREYLEEVFCQREESHLKAKKEDLTYLLTSKATQISDAASILTKGATALQTSVQKERLFFKGARNLLGKWNITAPIHGTIPKPFRAGEPLAVDCSFATSGSKFVPPTMSINDVAYAELSRTAVGLVRVATPEFHLQRTLQLELRSTLTSEVLDSYTLPTLPIAAWETTEYDELTNSVDDAAKLEEHNQALLVAVQHAVYCEETFETLMQEALLPSAKWVETLFPLPNYTPTVSTSRSTSKVAPISMSSIKDDEIQVRMDQHQLLTIRLVDASDGTALAPPAPSSLCHLATTLLLQETRKFHVRCNQAKRPALFTPSASPGRPRTLQTLINVLSHALLKKQLQTYLDGLAASLATGNAAVRVLDDGLCQPRCDSTRGIYMLLRWKVCPQLSTLAALELSIGKDYYSEVLVRGTRIECHGDVVQHVFGLDAFKAWVEAVVCQQVTIALHRDVKALGMKKVVLENDRRRLVLLAAPAWDGTYVGEGKISDDTVLSSLLLEPIVVEMKVTIACSVVALSVPPSVTPFVVSEGTQIQWSALPGASDAAKLAWLTRQFEMLPAVLLS